jgi:hypothetical protein
MSETPRVASKWEWHHAASVRYVMDSTRRPIAAVWEFNGDWLWAVGRGRYCSAASREQAQDDADELLREYGWTLNG